MTVVGKIKENLNLNKKYVIVDTSEWTYLDLKKYVYYINYRLYNHKIEKLIICLPQGFYTYSLIISSYLRGITFCPIDTKMSAERKMQIIYDFSPDLIICDNNDNLLNCNLDFQIISLTDFLNQIDTLKNWKFKHKRKEREIAYVIFTSGSTGKPKGVKIKRIAIEKLVLWAIKEFNISYKDNYAQYSPIHFDMSMLDIFGGTASGATLIPFAELAEKLFPGEMIKRHKITFWNSVPQFITLLENSKRLTKEYISSLETIKIGGDKIYPCQIKKLFEVLPDVKIILTYGPTETTIFCTYLKINRNNYSDYADKLMSIGHNVPGWEIIIENKVKDIGEIVVYGNYIADGYLSEDISNSFKYIVLNGKKEHAFYTGDFGYERNGVLYFIGRLDSQVKINGNRFDMSEVDYQMKQLNCHDSITFLYNEKILLFYTSNSVLTEDEVKNFLKSKLPIFGMPALIKRLDNMPLNSNGKIDKQEIIKNLTTMNNGGQ